MWLTCNDPHAWLQRLDGESYAADHATAAHWDQDGVERRVSQAIERKRHGKGHNRSRHRRTQQREVDDARRRSNWEQPPPWAAAERDDAARAEAAKGHWRRAGGAVQAARAFAAAGSRRRAEQATDPALVHALLDALPTLSYGEAESKLREHGWNLQAAVSGGVAAGGGAATTGISTCKTHVEATRQRRQRAHTSA